MLGEVVYDNEASDDISVKLEGGATQNYHRTIAKPVNPKNLDGVGDNTQLMHLHEPSLLFNLRFRYSKDLIYTYTGYILIAVNPYKALTCYGDQEMASYRGKSIGVLPPHLYAMADRAYRSMKVRPLPPPPRNSSAQFLRALTPSSARLARAGRRLLAVDHHLGRVGLGQDRVVQDRDEVPRDVRPAHQEGVDRGAPRVGAAQLAVRKGAVVQPDPRGVREREDGDEPQLEPLRQVHAHPLRQAQLARRRRPRHVSAGEVAHGDAEQGRAELPRLLPAVRRLVEGGAAGAQADDAAVLLVSGEGHDQRRRHRRQGEASGGAAHSPSAATTTTTTTALSTFTSTSRPSRSRSRSARSPCPPSTSRGCTAPSPPSSTWATSPSMPPTTTRAPSATRPRSAPPPTFWAWRTRPSRRRSPRGRCSRCRNRSTRFP